MFPVWSGPGKSELSPPGGSPPPRPYPDLSPNFRAKPGKLWELHACIMMLREAGKKTCTSQLHQTWCRNTCAEHLCRNTQSQSLLPKPATGSREQKCKSQLLPWPKDALAMPHSDSDLFIQSVTSTNGKVANMLGKIDKSIHDT